jgi:hypothetical protein
MVIYTAMPYICQQRWHEIAFDHFRTFSLASYRSRTFAPTPILPMNLTAIGLNVATEK